MKKDKSLVRIHQKCTLFFIAIVSITTYTISSRENDHVEFLLRKHDQV